MSEPPDELQDALEDIRSAVEQRLELERRDLRAVLVPIGELVLAGDGDAARDAVAELRRALRGAGGTWELLVEGELSLACAEHVHSVDPRYLDLENYDLTYTRAARRRLEARIAAAELLGIRPSEGLLEGVRRADRLLEERFGPA